MVSQMIQIFTILIILQVSKCLNTLESKQVCTLHSTIRYLNQKPVSPLTEEYSSMVAVQGKLELLNFRSVVHDEFALDKRSITLKTRNQVVVQADLADGWFGLGQVHVRIETYLETTPYPHPSVRKSRMQVDDDDLLFCCCWFGDCPKFLFWY